MIRLLSMARSSLLCSPNCISPISSINSVPRYGRLEQAHASFRGPRKGTLFVAEQFALDQGVRNRGAVDGDEGLIPPRAVVVNRPGHQLFARAAFALDQDRAVACRQPAGSSRTGTASSRAIADHIVQGVAFVQLRVQVGDLGRHVLLLQRAVSIRCCSSFRFTGLVRKSNAPSFRAVTALSTVPCPETRITAT